MHLNRNESVGPHQKGRDIHPSRTGHSSIREDVKQQDSGGSKEALRLYAKRTKHLDRNKPTLSQHQNGLKYDSASLSTNGRRSFVVFSKSAQLDLRGKTRLAARRLAGVGLLLGRRPAGTVYKVTHLGSVEKLKDVAEVNVPAEDGMERSTAATSRRSREGDGA